MFTKKSNSRAWSGLFSVLMLLAILLGSAAFPTNARALGATITVTSILDNATAGDHFCTLREAINNANANSDTTSGDCAAGLAGSGDVIVFSNLLVVYTVTLGSALPTITDSTGLTINGGDQFTVSGNNLYRVFVVGGSAPLTLDSLTISNGKVTSGTGGGIFNAAGMLTLTNCLLSGNSAVDGDGGGLYSTGGSLTITDSIFSNNSVTKTNAGGYGGGLYTFSPTTITRTIFSSNSANIRGGGLYSYFSTTTITDSTFSSNSMSSAGDGGGGIYNEQGILTITHSTFSSNAANSGSSNGGGIFNSQGILTITRSTFYNNSVTTGVGGGIASNGTLSVANDTFSSNYADFGGGVYNGIGGVMTATNNTFSGNSTFFTTVVGGGIYNEGTLNLYNTILANTVNGKDCHNSSNTGTVNGNNNLIELDDLSPNGCGTSPLTGDPNLGAATLVNPVYFPLNAGSPAIDAGDDAKCLAAPVNNASQNGITRPQGAHCEIGSYELDVAPTVLSSVRVNPSPTDRASVQFTVTFSEAVSGVNAADFTLTTTGVTGASITGVSADSGATRTVTVNTGSGDGSIRLNVIDNDSIVDASSNPLGGAGANNGNFTTGQTYTVDKTLTLNSIGTQDGWVLESSETSRAGGTINATAPTLRLGDDATKKQYRSILSFNTGAGLPDTAVIIGVTLKVKRQGIVGGGNPLTIFGGFVADIKNGLFGTSALQAADFQTLASHTYGPFSPALAGGFYSINLTAGQAYINKLATNGGLTQIRLRFNLDDNNNAIANVLSLFSGNATTTADRPQLIIQYYTP